MAAEASGGDEGRVGFSEVLAGGCRPAGQPWGQGAAGADLEPAASPREGLLVSAGGRIAPCLEVCKQRLRQWAPPGPGGPGTQAG